MKKFLLLTLAVVGLAACNNHYEDSDTKAEQRSEATATPAPVHDSTGS